MLHATKLIYFHEVENVVYHKSRKIYENREQEFLIVCNFIGSN